ncbi:MAG: hypothetical protein JWQ48_4272 [Conexibacter sp.]|jgi:hypothetical protein|nr:hypothetical protein [Conexibacter sp.]
MARARVRRDALPMIVRDIGNAWQIVLQTDHADLAGQFAGAWGGERFEPLRPRRSVVSATARHDDGWAIWERAPSLLPANGGPPRPRNFLDIEVIPHLAFYRAQITGVLLDDAYAGLLVSMHGCGIYNGRYGTDPALVLSFAEAEQRAVQEFADEEAQRQERLVAELGVDEQERWTNYRLLQVFDRLSLYFAMRDLVGGEAATIAPVPTGYDGSEAAIAIEPDGAWSVRMDPFPFVDGATEFSVLRRELRKREWSDVDAFRADFKAAVPERTTIRITPA